MTAAQHSASLSSLSCFHLASMIAIAEVQDLTMKLCAQVLWYLSFYPTCSSLSGKPSTSKDATQFLVKEPRLSWTNISTCQMYCSASLFHFHFHHWSKFIASCRGSQSAIYFYHWSHDLSTAPLHFWLISHCIIILEASTGMPNRPSVRQPVSSATDHMTWMRLWEMC